jgi:hypothetical protein
MNLEFYNLTCKISGDLKNREVAFLASLSKIEYIYLNYQDIHVSLTMSSN